MLAQAHQKVELRSCICVIMLKQAKLINLQNFLQNTYLIPQILDIDIDILNILLIIDNINIYNRNSRHRTTEHTKLRMNAQNILVQNTTT